MRKMLLSAATAAVMVAALAASSVAATWNIDTAHSVLSFKVRHLFSNTGGTFKEWSGTISFDPAAIEKGAVDVTIKSDSIDTGNPKRDGDLKGASWFDVVKYPEVTFKSTSIRKVGDGYELLGNLTIRGVSKPVVIPFKMLGSGKTPWGDTRAGFSGSVTVNRKDFGMEWNQKLDNGGVLVADEVMIELSIEAAQAAS